MTGKAAVSGLDSSRTALEYIHGLLSRSAVEEHALVDVLAELVTAFGATGAGLATLPDQVLVAEHGLSTTSATRPWEIDSDLSSRLQQTRKAVILPRPATGSLLVTGTDAGPDMSWVLWLEDTRRSSWTVGENAALLLAVQALRHCELPQETTTPRWAEQLNRVARQQRMETAAGVARRIAHDYGNVFTGILGFTELSLGHPAPNATLVHSYMSEVYRTAQNGARLTHQLRLFSRRQSVNTHPCSLAAALQEEVTRLAVPPHGSERLHLDLSPGLPPLAIDTEHLRHALGALLDNACDATNGHGPVHVRARSADLAGPDCADYFGDLRPGAHVVIEISDHGPGMNAEVRQRVLAEPFFTTKPRHRGLGLAVAYGILHAHRGGLRLQNGTDQGVIATVAVPAAGPANPAAQFTQDQLATGPPSAAVGGQKVLVVDDDPLVLQMVRATLERAGYRVQAVTCAEEALAAFAAGHADPFALVLSDVVMPEVNGVELARRLISRDTAVRLVFMSGHSPPELAHPDLAGRQIEVLAKPFRPEKLLRAVHAALGATPEASRAPTLFRSTR
jgi:signal transduction histidine kinase/ActR/RegA family two-component response regulator